MASITIARALTKLKTTKSRIDANSELIKTYGGINTKILSKLSTNKDVRLNHNEAREKIKSAIQSNYDLVTEYTTLSTKIAASNQVTYITSDQFGRISVAEALILTQNLSDSLLHFANCLGFAVLEADKSADKYNNANFKGDILNNLNPDQVQALVAQPETLFPIEEYTKIKGIREGALMELNMLINESNAITTIELD